MRSQSQAQSPQGESHGGFAVIMFVCRSMAFSIEAVAHRNMGRRFPRLHGVGAILLIALYTAFWPGSSVAGLLAFLVVYLIALLRHRLGVMRGRQDRQPVHSRSSGEPLLMRFFPSRTELFVKSSVEPFVVFVLGLLISGFDPPLGSYLAFAAIALAISINLDADYHRARAQDLVDASIEQEQLAERFREIRGDRTNP